MERYLPLILKNVWRNRRRTILTVGSIGISMCLLGLMVSLYHGFYLADPSPEQARRLVVRNKVSLGQPVPQSYQARIQSIPGVREVMIANWFGGTYKDNRDPKNQFARFGVEPEKLFKVYGEWRINEDEKKAFEQDRTGCVIGRDVANAHNLKPGDRLTLVGDFYPGNFDFTVRGIVDAKGSTQLMYFNKIYLDESLPPARRGIVGMYYVLADRPEDVTRISQAVDEGFRNSPNQTKTETEQAFTVGFLAFMGNVKMVLFGIAGAVMFTVLLVSANTMAMSVRERVREVGILKTLGFSPGAILGLILGEACMISLIGGLIGYSLSTLLLYQVAQGPFGGFLQSYRPFEPTVALVCVVAAGTIGLISSLVPAVGASRIPIVSALRSTD
jgi:putative ABC transport system permease protein